MEIKLILVCHKTAVQICFFLDLLRYFVVAKEPDISLGDFNVGFQSDLVVRSFMQSCNFVQLVAQSTHIRCELIDHVYINKDFSLLYEFLAKVTSAHLCTSVTSLHNSGNLPSVKKLVTRLITLWII